jgi:nucleotide-binding universal stress UspA family protein
MSDTDNIILVAQDGSPVAQTAASVAIQIAQSQSLLIRGLYVVDEALVLDTYANYQTELGRGEEPTSRAELVTRFQEQGEVALRWLEARCRAVGVPVTVEIEFGGVPELVLHEAAQAKLLALGRRGRGHAADSNHLGRHFRAIAHHTHQPVLIGGDEQRPIQRLLLAYNGSESAQRALAWAALLQRRLPTEVMVVAVRESADTPHQWAVDMSTRVAQSGLVHYDFISRTGQPAAEIVAAAVENQVDLIVIGRYRHMALLEWLTESTVDRVLRNTPLPVLVS